VFDNPNGNDKFLDGNKALPKPSVYVDTGKGPKHAGPFVGLKPIDLSPGGDGADDNRAVHNPFTEALDKSLGLIGVAGMQPLTGTFDTYRAFGRSALSSSVQSVTNGGLDVGIVNSDEPTFKRAATYPGRSVLFSFGFEGINSNTGYATREQVLGRILQWFDDHPTAKVVAIHPSHGQRVQLRASLGGGQKAAQYVWQVGSQTLKGTETPTTYTFPHAGTYKIRVLITDALGHSAVSPSAKVTVR
jgi:hypothetical protein